MYLSTLSQLLLLLPKEEEEEEDKEEEHEVEEHLSTKCSALQSQAQCAARLLTLPEHLGGADSLASLGH